jgi:broad specificity phosphatase PhoE
MSHILLARHGQSVSNAIRRFQGSQDVELSELGARQAAALARVLQSRPVAAVYTSPLARARRTAEIAAAGTDVPVTPVDDLRELCLGEWEGRTVEEIRALPGDPYAQWVRDPVACLPPGGEPLADVQARVVRAIGEIARAHPNGRQVLVVCHGGVISAYLAHCLGLSLSSIWRLTVSNASLTEVRPPRVHSVNNTRHLVGVVVRGAAEGEPRAELIVRGAAEGEPRAELIVRGAAEGEPRAELIVRGAAEGEPRAESDIALGYPTPTPRAP